MLPGFQQYLVDKGFKRTCTEHCGKDIKEDYSSTFLSTYNPLHYDFKKDNVWIWWGLSEHKKPPVMFLGRDKIRLVCEDFKTEEDGYRILFSKWGADRYDEIYNVLMSDNKYFRVDCTDEKNITIEIHQHLTPPIKYEQFPGVIKAKLSRLY